MQKTLVRRNLPRSHQDAEIKEEKQSNSKYIPKPKKQIATQVTSAIEHVPGRWALIAVDHRERNMTFCQKRVDQTAAPMVSRFCSASRPSPDMAGPGKD